MIYSLAGRFRRNLEATYVQLLVKDNYLITKTNKSPFFVSQLRTPMRFSTISKNTKYASYEAQAGGTRSWQRLEPHEYALDSLYMPFFSKLA